MDLRSLVLKWLAARPSMIRRAGSSRWVSDHRLLSVISVSEFHPAQKRSEVLALVDLIRSSDFHSMLEIGTSTGGTSLLVSRALRPPATLTTV